MRGEGRLCHGELRNGDGAEAAMPLKGIDHAEKFKKPFLQGKALLKWAQLDSNQ